MLETKAMVIHEILKYDKPFKARHIYEEMGCTPQIVHNHLRRLVEKGALIKSSTFFTVANKERLIDELISSTEGRNLDKVEPVPWFIMPPQAMKWQIFVDYVVRGRVLEKTQADDMHGWTNQQIDEIIEQAKRMKKWLNTKSYTKTRAADGFTDENWSAMLTQLED